ncbi:MFS general substrate transporter [Panus rudis PR-1116 ss-1]|nr:MFS general substrate transporter [Panus rudis PR-1116 ss-1]
MPAPPKDSDESKKKSKSQIVLTDQTNLLPLRKVIIVFCSLALCILVSALDSTIVATAMPTIATVFNAGSIVSWVPSAYLLTSTAFQPLYGRFSDIFGRKFTLCIAMALFMLGTLLSGFAPSVVSLIIFRGIAGTGGGGIVSIVQIVMSDVVSLRERGKYQGIIGGVVALGFAIGPLMGGALAEKVSWKWCFWINLPISAVSVVVVIFVLPLKSVHGDFRRKLLAVDYVGVALMLAGCTLIILPLIWGGVTFPWDSAVVLAPLCCGVFVLALFCLWEWRGAKLPIVPMYIFKHTTVSGVYITMFINGVLFYSALFYLPQFFQVALAYSPIHSGIFLLPVLVTQTTASFIAGNIVSRTGRYRTIVHTGFSVSAVGCGCLSTVTASTSKGLLVFYMLLTGTGAGMTLQTTTVAAQASVSRRDMSVVTAIRNFVRLLGGTFSLALAGTLINNALQDSMTKLSLPDSTIRQIVDDPTILATRLTNIDPTSGPLQSLGISADSAERILRGYTSGFRTVFILNASLAAFSTLVSICMIHHKELTREDDAEMMAAAKRKQQEKKDKSSRKSSTEKPAIEGDVAEPTWTDRSDTLTEKPGDLKVGQ